MTSTTTSESVSTTGTAMTTIKGPLAAPGKTHSAIGLASSISRALLVLTAIGMAVFAGGSAAQAQTVQRLAEHKNVEIWRIKEPVVTTKDTEYKRITFRKLDTVFVTAGGCVQRGGHGRSWYRFVDPQAVDDPTLYHGTITLPGMEGTVFLSDFLMNPTFNIPATAKGDLTLHVGYIDDNYTDNGYWSHDDGPEDQCQNVGNAWLLLVIIHQ
jgi:hypothetical protein